MDLSDQFCDTCGDRLHYDETRPEFTFDQLSQRNKPEDYGWKQNKK